MSPTAGTTPGLAHPAWPEPVGELWRRQAVTVYDRYPRLFAPAFPGIAEADLTALSTAARSYALALFGIDMIIDRDDPGLAGTLPLDVLALLHDSYQSLGALFGPDSRFWAALRDQLRAFMSAMMTERDFLRGARDTSELAEADAIELARGKGCVAEVTAAGLAALAADGTARDAVAGSIAGYNIACQFLDDVRDWRKDAVAGRPSLVLAEAMRQAGIRTADLRAAGRDRDAMLDTLGRVIYFGGAAASVLNRARAELRAASRGVSGLALEPWQRKLAETGDRAERFRKIIADSPGTVAASPRTQAPVTIRFPGTSEVPEREFILHSLRWLLEQWRIGFPEAKHVMRFDSRLGFTGGTTQVGEVFARALVAGTLLVADPLLGGQLRPCAEREARYLLDARRDEPGLWSYFPGLPELPPDADDVAEVLRVLVGTGQVVPVERELRSCLDLAFGQAAPDGSFGTWLIPPDHTGPIARRQREYAVRYWGTGADVEVMANLLHAAGLFDPAGFAEPVRRGLRYVLAAQHPTGFWPTTWYHGELYAAYACARLLASHPGTGARQLRACLAGIESSASGGAWRSGESAEPDPVSTALALLTLAEIRETGLDVPADLIRMALGRLMKWQDDDGGMPSAPFIRMEMGRTGKLPPEMLSYGSRTVTAALACRAALAWVRWDE